MGKQTTCTFINQYSEIEGLQKRRTVTYSASIIPEGIYLLIKEESEADVLTQACICSSASFENAVSFLKYICENNIDIGSWYDVLKDVNMPFTVV